MFVSYALITEDGARLYTNPAKVQGAAAEHLALSAVEVRTGCEERAAPRPSNRAPPRHKN